MSLKTIKERADAATPGPWGWTGNLKLRWVELSTLHSGRLGVMRFDRWGMTGAQPVFLDTESRSRGMGAVTTVKASDVPIFEVCRDATSAADPRVYRQDILGLRHPDAAFIAHARQDIPALLRVAEAAKALRINDLRYHAVEGVEYPAGEARVREFRAALAALEALP